jgi:large subunit ribosomal protein L21
MYAVIEIGGQQCKVEKGRYFFSNRVDAEVGDQIDVDKVLILSDNDGSSTLGLPYVDGAKVCLKVLEHTRGDKINIIKFKRRKHHMKRMGHRQDLTKLEVVSIEASASKTAVKPKPKAKKEGSE